MAEMAVQASFRSVRVAMKRLQADVRLASVDQGAIELSSTHEALSIERLLRESDEYGREIRYSLRIGMITCLLCARGGLSLESR